MIFFGKKAGKIKELDIADSYCQHCHSICNHRVTVFGNYLHVYWIPMLPIGKKAVAECTECLRTISQKEFPRDLVDKYHEKKKSIRSPLRHWAGLILIGAFAIFLFNLESPAKDDFRKKYLDADLKEMSANPNDESDTTAVKLKRFFYDFSNEKLRPSSFEFSTNHNNDKVLILAKIPDLKKLNKESRAQVIQMIELIANTEDSIKEKDKFIGVHGRYNFMMVKTPYENSNSNLVTEKPLYMFYNK